MSEPRATRTLPEQFAALPPEIQGELFSVLDVVIGMSADEKATVMHTCSAVCRFETTPDEFRKVVAAVGNLTMFAQIQATGTALPPDVIAALRGEGSSHG